MHWTSNMRLKMKRDVTKARIGTRALWAGEEESLVERTTQVPIVQSISFGYDDTQEWLEVAAGRRHGYIYSPISPSRENAPAPKTMSVSESTRYSTSTSYDGFPCPM